MTAATPPRPDPPRPGPPKCRSCGTELQVRKVTASVPLLTSVRICPVCDRPPTPATPPPS